MAAHPRETYLRLFHYLRELYQQPGVAATIDMEHMKHHYYASHKTLNPNGIVPVGPSVDHALPHDREKL